MAVFAISDLHLSFSTNKPMDIFNGWDNYVEKIKTNWCDTVGKTDTVVICGDLSWALKLEDVYDDFNFIHSLPGRKILIKGNHDLWWSTKKKLETFIEKNKFTSIEVLFNNSLVADNLAICGSRSWLINSDKNSDKKVFDRELGRIRRSIEAAINTDCEPTAFLHYPPLYSGVISYPLTDLLNEYGIKKCYYGHIHGGSSKNKIMTGVYENIYFDLLSCDYLKFKPLKIN